MLLKDNKKSIATIILGKMRGDKMEHEQAPQKDGALQDDSIALESAAEEIISAIKQDNKKQLVEALKSFYEMCESKEDSQEESKQD